MADKGGPLRKESRASLTWGASARVPGRCLLLPAEQPHSWLPEASSPQCFCPCSSTFRPPPTLPTPISRALGLRRALFTALLVQHFPLTWEAHISHEDGTGGTFQSQSAPPALTPAACTLWSSFFSMYLPGPGDLENHPQAHLDGPQPSASPVQPEPRLGLRCPAPTMCL